MGDYLRVSTVQVVQAIDLAELDKTIKWLVMKVQELPAADQANQRTIADSLLQDQIDALRRENNSLKDTLAQLHSKQDDIESRLDTKQDRDQAPEEGTSVSAGAEDAAAPSTTGEGSGTQSTALPDLERRLAAVEQRIQRLPTPSASETGEPTDAAPSGPDLNSQFQELLAGHRALAATVSGLQHELESKPNRVELDLKSNRSELDALLRAGVSMASMGDSAPPVLSVKSDGTVDNAALVEAVNNASGELTALRGQVAVMADRLQCKAEQGGVDDLASQIAALKSRSPRSGAKADGAAEDASSGQLLRASSAVADSVSAVAADIPDLDAITKRLDELELRVGAGGVGSSPPAFAGSNDNAVDSIGSLGDVQPLLKDIYARMDAKGDRLLLEDALRRLQDLTNAVDHKADAAALKDAAARLERMISSVGAAVAQSAQSAPDSTFGRTGSGRQQRKQYQQTPQMPDGQWIVSHELSDGTELLPAVEQLRASVAELESRVAQLTAAASPSESAPAPWPPFRMSSMGKDGVLDAAAVQGALAALHGQLGEVVTRLAGKADAGEVARLELALNSKVDVDELAEIRLALASKANATALGDLQVAVAGKADQAALDEVKLTAALAADLAAAANPDAVPSANGAGGAFSNLLGAIQGMVSDKASKAELAVLQDQLSGKASAEDMDLLRAALEDKASAAELSALMSQFPGRPANSQEIASLDQRMGDVFAELAQIRADMAALPTEALAGAAATGGIASRDGDTTGLQRIVSALSREVGTLREGLDTMAHAANILAVGLDAGVRISTADGVTGGVEGRYSESEGPGVREHRSQRGGYERLLKLLGSGDYRHKMEAFDPVALQQMAQKLAYLEATIKSPAMNRAGLAGVDYGIKELERQVKRLNTDVRLMKDKIIEPAAMAISGSRLMPPGDHAMLAARPITGYRCMACDRPLEQLDISPGPHVPTQQLPVRVPAATDISTRNQVRSGRGDPLSPQASSSRVGYNQDPNGRGIQSWYKDAPPVVSADVLPRDHVGPHLPPGGWRPSHPGSAVKQPPVQGSLPSLNGPKPRAPAAAMDYDPRSPPMGSPPIEGAAANVTLPQIQ